MRKLSDYNQYSKFRNLYGSVEKHVYKDTNPVINVEGQQLSASATNITLVSNPKGSLVVIPPAAYNQRVRLTGKQINIHPTGIVDVAHAPFCEDLIATASSNGDIGIVKVFCDSNKIEDVIIANYKSKAHERKCVNLAWNPTVNHVLASVCNKGEIKVWDYDQGTNFLNINHKSPLWSLDWTIDGKLLYGIDNNQVLNIFDIRSNKVVATSNPLYESKKRSCGLALCSVNKIDTDTFCTLGFHKPNAKSLKTFDVRNLTEPIIEAAVTGNLAWSNLHYDINSSILTISGRGDSTCLVCYIDSANVVQLPDYSFGVSPLSILWAPSKLCNVAANEILRAYTIDGETKNIMTHTFRLGIPPSDEFVNSKYYSTYYSGRTNSTADYWFSGGNTIAEIKSYVYTDKPQIILPPSKETRVLHFSREEKNENTTNIDSVETQEKSLPDTYNNTSQGNVIQEVSKNNCNDINTGEKQQEVSKEFDSDIQKEIESSLENNNFLTNETVPYEFTNDLYTIQQKHGLPNTSTLVTSREVRAPFKKSEKQNTGCYNCWFSK